MRLAGSRRRSSAGFTLIESLVGLLLAAVAMGTIADTLTGVLKRSYITIEVTRLRTSLKALHRPSPRQESRRPLGQSTLIDRLTWPIPWATSQ